MSRWSEEEYRIGTRKGISEVSTCSGRTIVNAYCRPLSYLKPHRRSFFGWKTFVHCDIFSNMVIERRNQQRVSQALTASPVIFVPSYQPPPQQPPPQPTQQPTPPHTQSTTAYENFDFSFDHLFTTLRNGVTEIMPPAMEASTSLPQYDPHHNPQMLPTTSLDTVHNLQAPHNMIPNVIETFPSPGVGMMASPPATDGLPSPNSDDGNLPVLHIAAFRGRTSIVSILLDQSLPVNEQDSSGRTPLHLASMNGHADVANILLARGALVNTKDNLGRTPIHWAALGQHEKTLKVLISQGADVNAADRNDWTVVHVCAERGWDEGLTAVLQAGGDLTRRAKKCDVWKRQEPTAD